MVDPETKVIVYVTSHSTINVIRKWALKVKI